MGGNGAAGTALQLTEAVKRAGAWQAGGDGFQGQLVWALPHDEGGVVGLDTRIWRMCGDLGG